MSYSALYHFLASNEPIHVIERDLRNESVRFMAPNPSNAAHHSVDSTLRGAVDVYAYCYLLAQA
jgi:hypothetical protein